MWGHRAGVARTGKGKCRPELQATGPGSGRGLYGSSYKPWENLKGLRQGSSGNKSRALVWK